METVIQFILGVVIVALGLAISIGLHEVGHLVPAKLFGVKVTQFMIGFGPTIFSRRRGETEYGFKAIPFGGYVSMIGMFPPVHPGGALRNASTGFFNTLVQETREVSAESVGSDHHRTYYQLSPLKKIIIMFGGPFMNLLIAIVMFTVVLCGFGTAALSTTIGSVSECVTPATSTQTTCTSDDPAAPGAAAGLLPGDTIVSIDGVAISSWEQSSAIIRESAGAPLAFVIERDDKKLTLEVTPLLTERYVVGKDGAVEETAAGTLKTHDVGFVGIGAATELVPQPVTAVLPFVGENIASVVNMILNLPQRLIDVGEAAFGTEERDPNGPISVVGVGRVAGEIASIDALPFASKAASILGLLGSLNVALFVINLVPLLPLDGGHIAGALWDAVRRGFARLFKKPAPAPVDTAKLMPLTFGVVIVLGAMSALLIYADIVKPISIAG